MLERTHERSVAFKHLNVVVGGAHSENQPVIVNAHTPWARRRTVFARPHHERAQQPALQIAHANAAGDHRNEDLAVSIARNAASPARQCVRSGPEQESAVVIEHLHAAAVRHPKMRVGAGRHAVTRANERAVSVAGAADGKQLIWCGVFRCDAIDRVRRNDSAERTRKHGQRVEQFFADDAASQNSREWHNMQSDPCFILNDAIASCIASLPAWADMSWV